MSNIPSSQFSVSEIRFTDESYQKLTEEVSYWNKICEAHLNDPLTRQSKIRLNDAREITSLMLEKWKEDPGRHRFLIAKDKENKTQSIASFENFKATGLIISYLVTNPYNISKKIGEPHHSPVRGAGSSIIQHIFEQTVIENKDVIYLAPKKGSISFYERHNFYPFNPWEKQKLVMRIDKQSIHNFLSSLNGREKRESSETDSKLSKRTRKC